MMFEMLLIVINSWGASHSYNIYCYTWIIIGQIILSINLKSIIKPSLQIKGLLGVVIEHKSHLHLGAVNSWIDVFAYIHTYK